MYDWDEIKALVLEQIIDDHPSRVIRAYVLGLNDLWGDEQRQRLEPYVERLFGSAVGPAAEKARALLVADWLVRVYAPAWLRLAGLKDHARALEELARITDATTARAAQPALDAAWKDATEAWSAAWVTARAATREVAWDVVGEVAWDAVFDALEDLVGDAVGDALWGTVGDAVENVVGEVAWDSVWSDAWATARAVAREAAWTVALNAAWSTAWAAAKAATRDAAGDAAWAVAWDAVGDVLQPTVDALQTSALELLDALLEVA